MKGRAWTCPPTDGLANLSVDEDRGQCRRRVTLVEGTAMATRTEDGSKEEKIVDELDILTLIHGFDTMLLTLWT
jgi:hypothetical protein